MSMYVALLAQSLSEADAAAGESLSSLVADALETRAWRRRGGRTPEPADRLARELAYDVALVRLCAALGTEIVVDDFTNPEIARTQLEDRLAYGGIDLDALEREKMALATAARTAR